MTNNDMDDVDEPDDAEDVEDDDTGGLSREPHEGPKSHLRRPKSDRREPYPGYGMYLTPCTQGKHADCGGTSNTHYLAMLKAGELDLATAKKHVHACQCLCHGHAPITFPGEQRQATLGGFT